MNWEEKRTSILYNVKRVNSVTGEGGIKGKEGWLLTLSFTLLRCGVEGSSVSVNDLEFKFPECPTFLTINTQVTPRVFWQSSHVYTTCILLSCSPTCSVCILHNNLKCFPFTLSKYQTDLDIYICLMKYTSSLTVPKWFICCYWIINIKISSQHKIKMLSLIAIWSEECFLHRN